MSTLRWLLLIPVLVTIAGLVTGADWLVRPTPGWSGLPLGNLSTWATFIILGMLLLDQARRLRRPGFTGVAAVLLAMAMAWGPIGFFASGNWRFVYTGTDHALGGWWMFSGLLAAALLTGLATSFLLAPRRRPGDPEA